MMFLAYKVHVVLLCVSTADFVLLICASQQWKVFECEHIEEWMVMAGENTDDPDPMEGRLFNPAPNFINCRYMLTITLSLTNSNSNSICCDRAS